MTRSPSGKACIHPNSPLRSTARLQRGLMRQLCGHQRQHVLSTPEESLTRHIVNASLHLIETLEGILLRLSATFLVGLDEAGVAVTERVLIIFAPNCPVWR